MSWRVTLDHVRPGNDFNVPSDGSMDTAVEKYAFQAPLKLFFNHRAALLAWWDACCRVHPFGPGGTYWPAYTPSGLFERRGDRYVDIIGDHELTSRDYGVELET